MFAETGHAQISVEANARLRVMNFISLKISVRSLAAIMLAAFGERRFPIDPAGRAQHSPLGSDNINLASDYIRAEHIVLNADGSSSACSSGYGEIGVRINAKRQITECPAPPSAGPAPVLRRAGSR